jgi:dTDP-4-dehydrorhamnose 3,5-epimerase
MPFTFTMLDIQGVVLIAPKKFGDSRGFFVETYKRTDFVKAGISEHFVQDNHSRSVKGVLRGLHYQKTPHAQGKLVRCLQGRIFDVAVDMRKGSATYGKWAGKELSSENELMLYIPAGFAHGFLVVSESADVIYKCTEEYSPEDDRGIRWNDPDIGIQWPGSEFLLSDKDRIHPFLKDADNNFQL